MNTYQFLFILLTISFISCNNESIEDFVDFNSSVTYNEAKWKGEGHCRIGFRDIGYDLFIHNYRQSGFVDHEIIITKTPKSTGEYPIHLNTNIDSQDSLIGLTILTLLDGDVLDDVYNIDSTYQNNYLQVISSDNGILKGRYEARLTIDKERGIRDESNPETVLLKDGYFELPLPE